MAEHTTAPSPSPASPGAGVTWEGLDAAVVDAEVGDLLERQPQLRVRVLRPVRSDIPAIMAPARSAEPGEHNGSINRHGAVSVWTINGDLGVRPGEFELVPESIAELQTWAFDLADALRALHAQVGKDREDGKRGELFRAIATELDHAYEKHGREPWGRHEFFAILLEEVDELKESIWRDEPIEAVLAELRQVAAMCFRYAETGDRYWGMHPAIPTRQPKAPTPLEVSRAEQWNDILAARQPRKEGE